jgi:hypothetical protein
MHCAGAADIAHNRIAPECLVKKENTRSILQQNPDGTKETALRYIQDCFCRASRSSITLHGYNSPIVLERLAPALSSGTRTTFAAKPQMKQNERCLLFVIWHVTFFWDRITSATALSASASPPHDITTLVFFNHTVTHHSVWLLPLWGTPLESWKALIFSFFLL